VDWLVFGASSLAIVVAGSLLARFADVISDRTGLGGLWIGSVLLAFTTSLPELVTDVSAARQGSIDLAAGDLFGSSMTNMAVLGFIGLSFRSRRLLQSVALENVLTATLAIALTGIAVLFILAPSDLGLGFIGLGPLVIAILYVAGIAIFREVHVKASASAQQPSASTLSLPKAMAGFLLCAAAILAAGPFLADSATDIAAETGIGQTFFGTLAVAAVTSLPELVVSVSAMRLGALDLAVGNLVGSNATNMALLFPVDLAYNDGSLLHDANAALVTAALAAVVLMAIGIGAIVLKAERRRLPFDPASALLLLAYIAGLGFTYDAAVP
jgi:cation:H+ antiporter